MILQVLIILLSTFYVGKNEMDGCIEGVMVSLSMKCVMLKELRTRNVPLFGNFIVKTNGAERNNHS